MFIPWSTYNRDEKKGYARGYQQGHKWPLHKPPTPPDQLIALLVQRTRELRDAVDTELAKLSADDDWQFILGEPIDRLDEAFEAIGKWLLEKS